MLWFDPRGEPRGYLPASLRDWGAAPYERASVEPSKRSRKRARCSDTGSPAGNARPDELTSGVGHLTADGEALGTGFAHHLAKEMAVEVRRGIRYGKALVSISVRLNLRAHGKKCRMSGQR